MIVAASPITWVQLYGGPYDGTEIESIGVPELGHQVVIAEKYGMRHRYQFDGKQYAHAGRQVTVRVMAKGGR